MSEKQHFYSFCFAAAGLSMGFTITGYKTKGVTLERIKENEKHSGLSGRMGLVACSYLGYMTREEMTGEGVSDGL